MQKRCLGSTYSKIWFGIPGPPKVKVEEGLGTRLVVYSMHTHVPRIESNREGTVNDVSIDVSPKVQLHNIIILQYSIITSIRGIVCSTVVDRAASGEGGACNIATEGQYNSIRAAQWLIEQPVGL